MQTTDHLQILIEHLIEVPALRPRLCKDHRQMQADCSDIEAPHKYRRIILICRLHTAALIPRAQKCTASHRADDFFILFIHTGNVSLTGQRQPVRIHRLRGALHTFFKNLLAASARSVQRLIVQKYDLREKYRLLISRSALSATVYIKQGHGNHFFKFGRAKP